VQSWLVEGRIVRAELADAETGMRAMPCSGRGGGAVVLVAGALKELVR